MAQTQPGQTQATNNNGSNSSDYATETRYVESVQRFILSNQNKTYIFPPTANCTLYKLNPCKICKTECYAKLSLEIMLNLTVAPSVDCLSLSLSHSLLIYIYIALYATLY